MKFGQHKKILLASGSPRRKEYLERYGFVFRVAASNIDEKMEDGEQPLTYAMRMATEKAEAVAKSCLPDEVILAADTIVVLKGRVLGKPADLSEAIEMLEDLNGRTHEVVTAYAILSPTDNKVVKNYSRTKVLFGRVSPEHIRAYVESEEPLDKAGSYSVQNTGTFLVERIEGSYNNVVGLPIEKVIRDLLRHGFIW